MLKQERARGDGAEGWLDPAWSGGDAWRSNPVDLEGSSNPSDDSEFQRVGTCGSW